MWVLLPQRVSGGDPLCFTRIHALKRGPVDHEIYQFLEEGSLVLQVWCRPSLAYPPPVEITSLEELRDPEGYLSRLDLGFVKLHSLIRTLNFTKSALLGNGEGCPSLAVFS